MPDSTQPKHVKTRKLMLVRYGRLGHVGWFEHDEAQVPKLRSKVLIKTERGLELGEIVGPFCYRAGNFRLTPETVDEYFRCGGEDQSPQKSGEFVRLATPQDINEDLHLRRDGRAEMETARRMAKEHSIPIDIVDVEHIFGGERIVFYFVAEARVDFRELVRLLAKEYQTRIEMRQIGSRDEARLMSDYETCGQECCCSRFMRMLKPVNMRMAKLQKATLDPSKISGYCGRLKCCLRFEDETYRELRERLPKRGVRMKTPEGMGTVVDGHILSQLVVFMMDDGRQVAIPLEELEQAEAVAQRPQPAQTAAGGAADENTPTQEDSAVSAEPAADEVDDDVMAGVEERYEEYRSSAGQNDRPDEDDRTIAKQPDAQQPPAQPKDSSMKWAPVGPAPSDGRDPSRQGGQQQGQSGQPGQGGSGRRRRRRRNKYKNQNQQPQAGSPQQDRQAPQGQQGQQRSDDGA